MREVLPAAADPLIRAMGEEGDLAVLRLARGCRCFAASAAEEVIAYGWLTSGPEWIGEVRFEIRPEPGQAYVWNCLTLPSHRRQGLFRAVLLGISSALQADGVSRLWIASGGGAEKVLPDAGFHPVLRLSESLLGLAGLRLVRATGVPGCEGDLVSAARRVLGGGGRPLGPRTLSRRPAARRH